MTWEKRKIVVPANVTMTRQRDRFTRSYDGDLVFNAKRQVDDDGQPVTDTWEFFWLGKVYTVLQSQVRVA